MTARPIARPTVTHLEAALGVALDPDLVVRSLTHRSYAYENGGLPTNERLEFLGDSVLGIVVTTALFHTHPDLPEGRLAKLRASVVNARALADVARGLGPLGLGPHLLLGKGEEATGGRDKESILADTLEAVLGAVYLQYGLDIAGEVIHRLFDPVMAHAARLGAGLDWKTSLQELTATLGLGVPDYHIDQTGPDHAKTFTAWAVVAGVRHGGVQGRTKKEAEQRAAEAAFEALTKDSDHGAAFGPATPTPQSPAPLMARPVPELPEVETVRQGLARWVTGRTIATVEVLHPRAVRRHAAGGADFAAVLAGRTIVDIRRRGKYLWFALDSDDAVLGHLGMSGQMLLLDAAAPAGPHLRVRFTFTDAGPELRFVDQRTFGGLALSPGGADLPTEIAHIARDPFDAAFDPEAFVAALRSRRTGVKRALLDQTLISGVGNIYADESLWRSRLHGERPAARLTRPAARTLLGHVRDVLGEALGQGGTSFDALYVNVNGESGYFDRALAVYGREGLPCLRCGAPIRREAFMNRSSYSCPRCQPRPRRTVALSSSQGQIRASGAPVPAGR